MAQPRPWTLLRERSGHDHRIFRTRTLEVADPRVAPPSEGQAYVRTVIDAPDWVNVVPVTTSGQVVLVRQFRFGTWANSLEIPGGMLDPGEGPAEAAARELEEETGYRPAQVVPLGSSHPNPALFSNRLHSFLALGCEQVHQGRPEAAEDLEVVLLSRAELRRAVLEGQVTHALVLAALLYEAWR
jgi:ADP-ribose pyrophosphatase